ncbi:MAG: hypothetical protein EPN79_11465 [Burkholderiaceae bacterium]|nr:MAG: hypothetical protein EPN79_11465 [Burkholderiaceae bacterium]TBR76697.1 MAG: hypothetical protein EPN64_05600 [Burkholderiaceae bacterium]
MGRAFEINEEDVEAVLRQHSLRVANSKGKSFESLAAEILYWIDRDAVEKAALYGDELDVQTRYAYEEIARQLQEQGVLEYLGQAAASAPGGEMAESIKTKVGHMTNVELVTMKLPIQAFEITLKRDGDGAILEALTRPVQLQEVNISRGLGCDKISVLFKDEDGKLCRGTQDMFYATKEAAQAQIEEMLQKAQQGNGLPAASPRTAPAGPDLAEAEPVTYWLTYGERNLTSVRLPAGLSADEVKECVLRKPGLAGAAVFCARPFETPLEFLSKIRASTVKVYNDRPVQEQMRRSAPFELRALFPKENPFFEITYESPKTGAEAGADLLMFSYKLREVWMQESTYDFKNDAGEGSRQRIIRVNDPLADKVGRSYALVNDALQDHGMVVVNDFGVGFPLQGLDVQEEAASAPRG